jgi:hypothetical protein
MTTKQEMNKFSGAPYSDQAILTVDVSDEAIESAASAAWEKSSSDARLLLRN